MSRRERCLISRIAVVADHWVLSGVVQGILHRAGHEVQSTSKYQQALSCLESGWADLLIFYLALGLDNHHDKNQALPFARWLAEQGGTYIPTMVLMRGYQGEPFRVAQLHELRFDGSFCEDVLPQLSHSELPELVAKRLKDVQGA